ncbi:MAG TPA: FlgD immunoglobulin-like domain containing protein [bacterium]|nr:FlgD immunoglobulin-like domain containing protein [bacterium]
MLSAVGLLVLLSANPTGSSAGAIAVTVRNPAQLTSFEWQNISSPQYAGESISVVVLALDADGNTYPFNGIALLSSTAGDAYVYPKYITFSNGHCSAKVVVTIAESIGLQCANDTVTGSSNIFDVLPGEPARLVAIMPGEQLTPGIPGGHSGWPDTHVAGDTFPITVYMTDDWFNLTPSSGDSVFFGSDDAFAGLPRGGALSNGTGSFSISLRAAGVRHVFTNAGHDSTIRADTSAVSILAGTYAGMLLVAPGEALLPGDTTTDVHATPGKSGTPYPEFLRTAFAVSAYACDDCWNPCAGPGDTICLTSGPWDLCSPPIAVLNDSAKFTFQFTMRGENRPLWVRDSTTKAQSYVTYIDVRALGSTISVDPHTPDTIRAGDTAAVKVLVRDVNGQPIPTALVQFARFKGSGTMIEPALLTDTNGYATSHFVCMPSPASEQDSIRISSGGVSITIGIYVRHLSDSLFAFPNPFGSVNRDRTEIFYSLQQASSVRVTIYDLFGNEVWARHFDQGGPGGMLGDNTVYWDGTNNRGLRVASGVYLIQVLGTLNTGISFKNLYRVGVVW